MQIERWHLLQKYSPILENLLARENNKVLTMMGLWHAVLEIKHLVIRELDGLYDTLQKAIDQKKPADFIELVRESIVGVTKALKPNRCLA